MTPKVRIVRKRVPFRGALFRVVRLVEVCLNIYNRHTRAANRDYLTEIRAQKTRKDTELAEMRRQKVSNDLVLQDLEIEKRRLALGYPATGGTNRASRAGGEGAERAVWDRG